ncbi:glucose-1-phosphate cytidylyltransferase [Pseudonocardia kongjuensis]|uniref:Glucose-1-phosphate cytidylyltransferase n=1 Tax=Pseudonocardia kongjuensis TaxID=102227 RepID=A0ABN1Y441_9PSEU
MKVVLFCGGYGMRMRDGASDLPKPMHPVGPRPLIWHVMRYYAHFGHKDFILCLGYGAHHIKNYFLNYDETESNDFVLHHGEVDLMGSDIQDWNITFVHTGLDSPIGERLRRVRHLVEDDEMFHANYADVLTDAPLDRMVEQFRGTDAIGQLMAVPPQSAFHCVDVTDDGKLESITTLQEMPLWENGGYLMFRPGVFEYLEKDCDLIGDVCAPLARKGRMAAFRHRGFWQPADTVKERNALEAAYQGGARPWMLWESHGTDRDPLQAAIVAMHSSSHQRD